MQGGKALHNAVDLTSEVDFTESLVFEQWAESGAVDWFSYTLEPETGFTITLDSVSETQTFTIYYDTNPSQVWTPTHEWAWQYDNNSVAGAKEIRAAGVTSPISYSATMDESGNLSENIVGTVHRTGGTIPTNGSSLRLFIAVTPKQPMPMSDYSGMESSNDFHNTYFPQPAGTKDWVYIQSTTTADFTFTQSTGAGGGDPEPPEELVAPVLSDYYWVDGENYVVRSGGTQGADITYLLQVSINGGVDWIPVTFTMEEVQYIWYESMRNLAEMHLRVRAERTATAEYSPWSTSLVVSSIPPNDDVDFIPTLTITETDGDLTITRDEDVNHPEYTYRLEASLDEVQWDLVTDTMGLTHVTGAPAPGVTYYYRARAEDGAEVGPWSEVVSYTTPEPEPETISFVPTLTLTEADGDLTITRDEDASNPAYTYSLEVSLDEVQWDLVTDTMSTTHVTGAPAPGVTYYYRARAESGALMGAWSEVVSYTTPNPDPEPEPVAFVPTLSLSVSGENITVSRDEDLAHPEYTYRLESSTEGREWMLLSSSMGTQFSDVAPPEGETVEYRARAEAGTEVGAWSALVSYTTPVTPPPPDPEPVPAGAPSEGGATLRIRREDDDTILLEASNWDRDAEVHLLDLGGWDTIPHSNREYHEAALGGGGWFSRHERYQGRTVTTELSISASSGLRLRELRAALVEAVQTDLTLEVIRTEGGETIIERLGRCVVDDEILWRRTREHVDASIQFHSEESHLQIGELLSL